MDKPGYIMQIIIVIIRSSGENVVIYLKQLGFLALLLAAFPATAFEITDQRGKTASFDRPAERLVFIPIPIASTFIAVDGSPRKMVGMNPLSMNAIKGGILETMFPEVVNVSTDVVKGGRFTPNIETILSLAPDVVFQWADIGDHMLEPLDRAGLRVLGMKYGTQADLEYYTGMLGQVAGKSAKVDALFARFHDKRTEIERQVASIPAAKRPGVAYFGRYNEMNAYGIKTYHDFYVDLVGGRNVAEGVVGSNTTVTVEQVLAWDPEVILLGNFDNATPQDVYNDPRWRSLRAVRSKRVYKAPMGGVRWDPPGEESVLTWMWLANLLHPDRFSYDIRGETRAHYRFLYNYALSDAQLDKILRLADNKVSVHYAAMAAAPAR